MINRKPKLWKLSKATRLMVSSNRWNMYTVSISNDQQSKKNQKIKYCIPTENEYYFYDNSGKYLFKDNKKPDFIKFEKRFPIN